MQRHPQQRKSSIGTTLEDFSLEDVPAGHPAITREGLDSIGEFAFIALRREKLLIKLRRQNKSIPPLRFSLARESNWCIWHYECYWKETSPSFFGISS
jgi:hypothetical protein